MKARIFLLLGLAVVAFSLLATNGKVRASDDTRFTWAINGQSALAKDGSTIMLTGTGTFAPDDPEEATGQGTWAVSSPAGNGNFKVRGLIRVDFTESVQGSNLRGGLLFLRVAYSDGSRGLLAVSCRFGSNVAPAVVEGITASKGVVDYFQPAPGSHTPPFQQLSEE